MRSGNLPGASSARKCILGYVDVERPLPRRACNDLQNVFEAVQVKGLTVAKCEYILTYGFEFDTFVKNTSAMLLKLPDQ
jgi:hypothetical protein